MSKPLKQIHLAAHFPGVNNTTVWSDPAAGSHIEFSSFVHFARTAERAKFDFLFLAEGLRLREQGGRIYDLDVVGRPDTFTVLAALAAVTDRLGLTGTINSTFNEPYEVARQFASLDHLSGGRSAWNVVTSWDAFTGENFRRGGFLPQEERYSRAKEFLATAHELFDSWRGDEIIADQVTGTFLRDAKAGAFVHQGQHFDIHGRFNVPRSPQGRPVVFQAGDSDEGREFAAAGADAIFSRYSTLKEGQAFYTDVKSRLAVPHPRRARPVRRQGGPAAPGTGRLPRRLRGHDPARPPRPRPPRCRRRGRQPHQCLARAGRVVKFLAITLIAHRPDPVTGVLGPAHERFREVLDNAVLAEELGFDGFGVGERHERPFLSSAPTVVLSHVAALTRRIRLFTAVTTLSLLDPVRAYED
ncbi:Pyrimidine monooxygenase RutA [Streptomyces canarius]